MNGVNVGDVLLWKSNKGYSLPAGQRAEVYAADPRTRRAAINLAPNDPADPPDGYSMSVSFDELYPMPRPTAQELKARHITAEGSGPTNENPDGCYYCGRDHHSHDCMDEEALQEAGEL